MNAIELGWKETKGVTYHNFSLSFFGCQLLVSFDRYSIGKNRWTGNVMDGDGFIHQERFEEPIDAKNYCLRKAEELSKQ